MGYRRQRILLQRSTRALGAPWDLGGNDGRKDAELVLVTGGGGLLGRALVGRLLARGDRVRVLRRGTGGGPGETFRGDVTDPASLEPALRDVRTVYHLAALVDHYASPEDLDRVNVGGTVNVAEAAARAGAERFVHCSSVSAEPGGGTTEYGRSKIRSEEVLAAYAARLPAVTVRPGPIYCEDRPTLRQGVRLARRARLCAVLVPDLTLHVASRSNVVEALMLAADRGLPGAAYAVCDARPVARSLLSRIIAEKTGAALLPLPLPLLGPLLTAAALAAEGLASVTGSRPRLTRRYLRVLTRARRYDIRAAETDLGYRPNPTEAEFAVVVARCLTPFVPEGGGPPEAAPPPPTRPASR